MRTIDLPPAEHFQHGMRAKYVSGCRCDACRIANSRYVTHRDELAKQAARDRAHDAVMGRRGGVPQMWTAPDGTKQVRVYTRACPGVNRQPCAFRSHLRKDSTGGLCARCRAQLVWNGLVSVDEVSVHLKRLSRQGVGYKSVALAADVSRTSLAKILAGTKFHLRAQAARRVLAVDRLAVADGTHVKAGPTWKRIQRLIAEGFTKSELARRLGSRARTPALQIRRTLITARTAMKVERLYRTVMTI